MTRNAARHFHVIRKGDKDEAVVAHSATLGFARTVARIEARDLSRKGYMMQGKPAEITTNGGIAYNGIGAKGYITIEIRPANDCQDR